jgi:GTP-binding protein
MKKLFRVVIVGFPNVGKSTLFNRILGQRKALVHTDPGMTRDSLSATCVLEGKKFVLVDTGGLFGVADEPLSDKVREKALEEAAAADLVLFVLDGKRDVAAVEKELFISLKKRGLPILLVVNKVDSERQEESMTAEYYRLGEKNIYFISAEHKINVGWLEEAIVAALPEAEPERDERAPLRIAIIGRTNVGKSSLVNRLAGEERLIVSEMPGTTRDSTDTLLLRDGKPFCLVDTAGIRRLAGAEDSREKAGILRAKSNIGQADVLCLILDVQEFPTRQDARIAQLALESGRPLIIALNKWDLVDKDIVRPDAVRARVFRKLGFVSYAPLLFVSARTGQRVVKILDTAEQVFKSASTRIGTPKLNDFLARTAEDHLPRLKSGARAKLRYMTQKGVCPPTFILFLGSRGPISPTYEKYFLDSLRETFGFVGTPVRLIVRTS